MTEEELKARTKAFALRVMRLVDVIPNSCGGRAIAGQLVRCGTAVGANYRASCRGRSKAEFVAKLGIVEEEADETCFWLELLMEGGLMKQDEAMPLWQEAHELTAIITSSITTARNSLHRPRF